ncbi:MAG: divergent polysaccharide deacetylase family protein [Marinobacterium sp.]|nr:divergent polysaccharide deacetylase family protein [Marinobacterium sp.]
MTGSGWGAPLTRVITLLAVLLSAASQAAGLQALGDIPQPRVVVVIDDMGNDLRKGRAALKLPGPVTYAFLPHLRHTPALAEEALFRNKEVILHAPMENSRHLPLGPGGLTSDLPRQEVQRRFNAALDAIPGVIGFNNHTGSLLTRLRLPMEAVMDVARDRGMFFLDSVTAHDSVAWKVAREKGIPFMSRDIFLDHYADTDFIDRQFRIALDLARKRGHVVMIGHPYPETINYLRAALLTIAEDGFQQLTASAFIMQQQALGEEMGGPDPVSGPVYYPN